MRIHGAALLWGIAASGHAKERGHGRSVGWVLLSGRDPVC